VTILGLEIAISGEAIVGAKFEIKGREFVLGCGGELSQIQNLIQTEDASKSQSIVG
jgi:hypothetical protein